MKIVIGFMAGIFFAGMLMMVISFGLPALAGSSDNTTGDDMSLTRLLPDIEKIYREALLTPFIKAKAKITDPDIADYYHNLLDKSGVIYPAAK